MTLALLLLGTLGALLSANAAVIPGCVPVACFADPCAVSKGCDAYPEAKCRSNYCGGCNAEYFLNGQRVNCAVAAPDVPDTKPPVFQPEAGCPPHGALGACVVSCASHDDCGESHRCCSNGCGRTCQPLYLGNVTRPKLACPKLDSNSDFALCVEMCSSHADCGDDSQLCCSNGCGHTCQAGVEIQIVKTTPKPQIDDAFPTRYDCPKMEEGGMGICMNECESDDDCNGGDLLTTRGNKKCCGNGCGKVCTTGVLPLKTGSCPAPPQMGPCVMTCTSHYHCAGEQLCCPHGCGQICKSPVHNATIY